MTAAHPTGDAWKPCDLRGPYPDSVSPDLFRDIGGAVATLLDPVARVVVAGDFRSSTPTLKHALSEGLLRSGADVLDAGQLPTPIAYFAAEQANAGAMLMVTASHNPPAHNGLKLMLRSTPMTAEQLLEIRALAESRAFRTGSGRLEYIDPRHAYMKAMTERWAHLREVAPARVVLDAGNGAWSEMAPAIFRALGFTADCISCVADGAFPDRSPDCNSAANLAHLRSAVRAQGDAIGIAWDGDGDRVAFVDEKGSFVSADEVAILFAQAVLAGEPQHTGSRIVVDIKCSDVVRRAVLDHGGTPLLERTGHAFMRSRVVAEDALLGLDACGHYFFAELNGGDDGLFAAFYLLDLLSKRGEPLCRLRRSLPQIHSTPEIRVPASQLSYAAACDALARTLPEASVTQIDGMRFETADGIVLVRESGTEPVLSLRIEGFTSAAFEGIFARCAQALPQASAQLGRETAEAAPIRFARQFSTQDWS
jgi:phosphomannomutase / phosphoglucomutase